MSHKLIQKMLLSVGGMTWARSHLPATDALFMAHESMPLMCNDVLDQAGDAAVPREIFQSSFQESHETANSAWSSDLKSLNETEEIFPKIEWCFRSQPTWVSAAKRVKSPGSKPQRRPRPSHVSKANWSHQMIRSKSFESGLCFLVASSLSSATNFRAEGKNPNRLTCSKQSLRKARIRDT
jgi:hypothetical protein